MLKKLYIFYFLLCPVFIFAYLDPGSGSALMYALVGFSMSVAYFAKGLWLDVTLRLGRSRKSKSVLMEKADILFHSEGSQYDHLFFAVIKHFSGNEKIIYITQYIRDPEKFAPLPPFVSHYEIDSGARGFAVLNLAKAKIFVTTTPQLDVMMFRRSKKVGHYCHMLHAASDISTYRYFSFDRFDSILCAGEYMKDSFRELEKLRKTKAKKLFVTGVPYFDDFAAQTMKKPDGKIRKTVLVAPSWGPNGLFAVYGTGFLKQLTGDFKVIVRPHPQLKISQRELYEEAVAECTSLSFEIDESPSNAGVLSVADLMITDFSGVAYDFAFGYEKPVITMDTHLDYSLFEGRFLNTALWPEGVRSSVGTVVDSQNVESLSLIIAETLTKGSDKAKDKRDLYLANFGHAGETAKNQILEILSEMS